MRGRKDALVDAENCTFEGLIAVVSLLHWDWALSLHCRLLGDRLPPAQPLPTCLIDRRSKAGFSHRALKNGFFLSSIYRTDKNFPNALQFATIFERESYFRLTF